MSTETDEQNAWGTRKMFLAAMLCQTLGPHTIILLPQQAIMFGGAGHMLIYAIIYIFIGIPLLYMEYVIAQFTGRNCLEVWKVRPCLSHFAYVQIFWQMFSVIFSHSFCSFVVHYFLISFEDPIPYYICGSWATPECNILYYNYTIHQDCLTVKNRLAYCSQLCTTFPEYQYWRYYMLGLNKEGFYLAWRVTLASGMIVIALFLSCFKRTRSVRWVLVFCSLLLISGRFLFLIGSMLQKGIVVKFGNALDIDFSTFLNYVELPACTVEVLFSLNLGTGISFNLASRSSFRSHCYSNTVTVVVISAAITLIGTCSNAMMLCPYSFKHGVNPYSIAKYPMFITFEMTPRLLNVYESKSLWLILSFSLIAVAFYSVNTTIISSLIDILAKNYATVARYPGLVTVLIMASLHTITIPLLANKSFFFLVSIQRGLNFLPIFLLTLECFVFLIFYGWGRFSEDVHFMLGLQPKLFVKMFWVVSICVLLYVFVIELYVIHQSRHHSFGTELSWWLLVMIIAMTILVTAIRVLRALYYKKLHEEIDIDPTWGPKSEVLQRSRAMFTTHAMTKEYIYRQYHLQAGILMRQRRCNIRN